MCKWNFWVAPVGALIITFLYFGATQVYIICPVNFVEFLCFFLPCVVVQFGTLARMLQADPPPKAVKVTMSKRVPLVGEELIAYEEEQNRLRKEEALKASVIKEEESKASHVADSNMSDPMVIDASSTHPLPDGMFNSCNWLKLIFSRIYYSIESFSFHMGTTCVLIFLWWLVLIVHCSGRITWWWIPRHTNWWICPSFHQCCSNVSLLWKYFWVGWFWWSHKSWWLCNQRWRHGPRSNACKWLSDFVCKFYFILFFLLLLVY